MAKTEILTLRIDKKTKDKLELLADKKRRSVSNYVLMLIDFAIENANDDEKNNGYTNKQSEILKELGIKIA